MASLAIFCHKCYAQDMGTQQTSMNVSLPEMMRRWVEERVSSEGYGTVSEYFRAWFAKTRNGRHARNWTAELIQSLDSGEATELTPQDWQHIRSTVRQRVAKRAKRG